MCGICGYTYSKDDFEHRKVITEMLETMVHRGPDDQGIYIDQKAVLGIRRLSIIDLHTGNQPIHNEDTDIWITYNGEIYNYQELREFLESKGHRFYTKTDTEVVLHLYEEFDEGCVDKLNGMFAFAIWDTKKEILFLARDRFGMKPLYYSEYGDSFIFASELKAILRFPGFTREIDLVSLDQYLTFEYIPAPRSIFKKIQKLPAAHCLVFNTKDSKISTRKYWDISFPQKYNAINEEEASGKLLQILELAIKRHLYSDVPMGIFLSGGIDSSIITTLASRILTDRVKTFSIGFRESSFDETDCIQRVARFNNTEHYHRYFSVKDMLNLLPRVSKFLDEPLADASFFPVFLLSEFAKENITVALSGDGGDELFAGYPTYQAHKLASYYRFIPYYLKEKVLNRIIMSLPVSMKDLSIDFRLKRFISFSSFPLEMRHIFWMGAFSSKDKMRLYTSAFNKIEQKNSIRELANKLIKESQSDEELNKLQYLDIKTYLQDDLLMKTDRASMANSIEVRLPYLDYELVDFVFSLPPALRLNNLKTKYIFKKMSKCLLPKDIIERKKKGFGIPLSFWMQGELSRFVLNVLERDKIKKEGLFNYQYIEELLQGHFKKRADNRKKIWALVMFELWLEEYVN